MGPTEHFSTKRSKSDQKQKFFIPRTFFVNKQLTLFINYLKTDSLNFAQNFRKCSFNPDNQKSVEKSKRAVSCLFTKYIFGPSIVPVQDKSTQGATDKLFFLSADTDKHR